MRKIFCLTDYNDRFGNKHGDIPYRSGMDKELLRDLWKTSGYESIFLPFVDINNNRIPLKDEYVLYTSQEDTDSYYKDFIEDIIYGLKLAGVRLIPDLKYLRAHNNKVFMEQLRYHLNLSPNNNLTALVFGTFEELQKQKPKIQFPVVVKKASGANSTGIYLAKSEKELISIIKKISRTKNIFREAWEIGRSLKHKSYQRESKYRKKYIIQKYIPDLENDWKVYVYGQKYYIFYRPILKRKDFRASGGGYENYYYGSKAKQPEGIFDFARDIYLKLDVPNASLDIAYDGSSFYLIEFQAIHFGTAGILFSDCYFEFQNGAWQERYKNHSIEEVYVSSIVHYLK